MIVSDKSIRIILVCMLVLGPDSLLSVVAFVHNKLGRGQVAITALDFIHVMVSGNGKL